MEFDFYQTRLTEALQRHAKIPTDYTRSIFLQMLLRSIICDGQILSVVENITYLTLIKQCDGATPRALSLMQAVCPDASPPPLCVCVCVSVCAQQHTPHRHSIYVKTCGHI